MKKLFLLFTITAVLTSCSTVRKPVDSGQVQLQGTLEATGMTTYQYGTHTLTAAERSYALKSSQVDLKVYEGKKVSIKGTKVAGYPVENGPDLIQVTAVKLQ